MAVLLLAWWGTAACQRRDTLPRHAGEVPTDSLFLGSTSGLEHRERVVIRDSAAWVTMWGRLTATQGLPLGPPAVAFDSSLVVVVSAGSTGAGHSIRIDSARVRGADLEIYVRETKVEMCNMSDMMMRSPAHAVRVRRTVESVRFVEDSTVRRCPRP
jgi:hypothetical protein